MSIVYQGDGNTQFNLAGKDIILNEQEAEELKEMLTKEDESVSDLNDEIKRLNKKIEELTEEAEEVHEVENESMDAMNMLELVQIFAPNMTINELLTMDKENPFIPKISRAVNNNNRAELIEIIEEINNEPLRS